MPEKNEWLLPTKTMMWWIIYVISFISNAILFLCNSHTFIVKLQKSVTCWMCICVCMIWIEWKVNKISYYHFKIWCLHIIWANLWRRDLSCRDTLAWIQRYTSTHFLIDWQPGVGILLLHINLCLPNYRVTWLQIIVLLDLLSKYLLVLGEPHM